MEEILVSFHYQSGWFPWDEDKDVLFLMELKEKGPLLKEKYLWEGRDGEIRDSYYPLEFDKVSPYDDDNGSTLLAFITAILSSSVLASFIRYWLLSRRSKITISVGDRKVEYEGPNIKQDEATIQAMIEQLLQEEKGQELSIDCKLLPEEETEDQVSEQE